MTLFYWWSIYDTSFGKRRGGFKFELLVLISIIMYIFILFLHDEIFYLKKKYILIDNNKLFIHFIKKLLINYIFNEEIY